jgi:hypothetical protein
MTGRPIVAQATTPAETRPDAISRHPRRRQPRGLRCGVCNRLVGQRRWAFLSTHGFTQRRRAVSLFLFCAQCADDVLAHLQLMQQEHER